MKYISTFAFLLFLAISVNAQDNYRKGYIVTNKNDTIKGLIDFQSDKMNCSFCKFKLSEKDEDQTYYPKDLIAYMFVNEKKYYISRTINIDNQPQKVFLEYLVQGIKDLFYYPLKNGCYYFEDENGEMIAVSKEYNKIENNKLISDNKYKGVLSYIFRNSKSVSQKAKRAFFDRKSMITLTKSYHSEMCAPGEECIVFANDYRKSFMNYYFSIYAGYQSTKVTFKNTLLEILYNSINSTAPIIGVQLEMSNPRLSKPLSLQIDASLSKLESSMVHLSSIIATGSIGPKYSFMLSKKLNPTIEAGVSYSQLFKTSTIIYYNGYYKYSLPSNYFGLYGGAGLDYQLNKKHSIFCKLLFSHMYDWEANIDNTQLKLGFTF